MQTTSLQGKFFAQNLHYLNHMLIGGGVILIGLLGYWVWLFQNQKTPDRLLYYALLILLGFLVFGLKERFASPKKRGLLLDEEGFLYQQTALGRKIGKILWKDIADLQATTLPISSMQKISCVLVTFTDPIKYDQRLSAEYREYLAQHNGRFPVVSGELEIGLEEMADWMMMYWKKYR
ncbi:MAG: hypothetical protein Q4B28_07290 [bacterium]|nr:hypothetical protein [bacterium]